MKDPNPIHLLTPSESRARGWTAEARDSDGHLMSQHAPFDTVSDMAEYVVAANSRGHTVTIWPMKLGFTGTFMEQYAAEKGADIWGEE